MPRQRRRRRSRPARAAQPQANVAERAREPSARPPARRRWWLPTLGVALAFSLGLWIGGLLSTSDSATAVALIGGAIGVGLTSAHYLTNRLRARRAHRQR